MKFRLILMTLVVTGGLVALSSTHAQPKLEPPPVVKEKAADPKGADPKGTDPKGTDPKGADPKAVDTKGADPKSLDAPKQDEKKDEPSPVQVAQKTAEDAGAAAGGALKNADTAWMLVSTAFVMLMVPGLALFYGGMARRKNVLATMMQSMICLSVIGVFWIAIGYSLAFGDPWIMWPGTNKSILGFSPGLVFMRDVRPDTFMPNLNIPVYLHMAYQGMFAIITPALISGALAERIKFKSYLAFILVWMVVVYCPLAQMVWAMNWNWSQTLANDPNNYRLTVEKANAEAAVKDAKGADALKAAEAKLKTATEKLEESTKKADEAKAKDLAEKEKAYAEAFKKDNKDATKEDAEAAAKSYYTPPDKGGDNGKKMTGHLGGMDALDFAGGTVVHIAAGLSSLACFLMLRKRYGYPEHAFHPNSMVLTLTGAGILWFGWFGFNGGSGLGSGTLATSAFTATQMAAAGAGLTWVLVEWFHRGKPTALGFASGVVAGLVAVTPASGYVVPWAGLVIGLIAGVVCYCSVFMKSIFKYDDSLDAFGVHGIGGFLGAVLTGFLCWKPVNSVAIVNDGFFYAVSDPMKQVGIQLYAAVVAVILSFVASLVLVKIIDLVMGFTVTQDEETTGLDRVEHGESGFDLGLALETAALPVSFEPKAAMKPADGVRYYTLGVEGASSDEVAKAWSELCQPGPSVPPEFKAIYPNFTTVNGSSFRFRGGDPNQTRDKLQTLLSGRLKKGINVKMESGPTGGPADAIQRK